ncbi:MAG: glycosyltransferase family 4 protein [Gemmataceae bacterium]|nr:glycosyltransferase family 4 protein [Gemmata sp.]MDW8198072.1 glycosyltransferase family 4 protein [Gemmataceae bacterium]
MTPRGTTLLVSDIFPPHVGGTGRWFWEIYRRWPRSEFAIAAGEHPQAAEFDTTHDLRVFRFPLAMTSRGIRSWSNMRHYLRLARGIRQLVRPQGVHLLHAARPLPEGLISLLVKWQTGIPYCCNTQGEDINIATTSRELRWLTHRVLRGASAIIPCSQFTRELLRNEWNVPTEKIRLLYPGVDCDFFQPAPRNDEVREQLGWRGRLVILTVGRLQRRKGHDVMIEAIARLRERFPTILYAIAGDGEERERLTTLVSQWHLAAQVQLLGTLDDTALLRCYQQCDLFALPNRAVGKDVEGFGMVLLEAQACGRPVLAGASGGTAETLRHGETGVCVPCERADNLAASVAELLTDPDRLERMGRAGRSWVEKHFHWPSRAAEAYELFTSLRQAT